MKNKAIMFIFAIMFMASPVFGGSYTINTTAEEDAAITEEAAKRGQTADEYMQEYIRNAIKPHAKRLAKDKRARKWAELQDKCAKGDTPSCNKVNNAKAALGL